jgi:hypothetical protein
MLECTVLRGGLDGSTQGPKESAHEQWNIPAEVLIAGYPLGRD